MADHLVKLEALDFVPITRGYAAWCAMLLRQRWIVTLAPVIDRMHARGLIVEPSRGPRQGSRYYPELTDLGRAVGREYQRRYGRR